VTTPTHPTELTPRVTDEHYRLVSELLALSVSMGPTRTELAEAIALAEQRGRAAIAATITEHAKDADEAAAVYTRSVLTGRSRADRAAAAVAAGQASAVALALRGVLSA